MSKRAIKARIGGIGATMHFYNIIKETMEKETIKSVTNCPVCNSQVKVEGNTTQYYVPIAKYTEDEVRNIALHLYFHGRDELEESRFSGKYIDTSSEEITKSIKKLNK